MKNFAPTPVIVAVITSIIAVGAISYIGVSKYQESQQAKADQRKEEQAQVESQRVALESAQKEVERLKTVVASSTLKPEVISKTIVAPKVVSNLRVTSQLKVFDDFLEYELVGTDVDCGVLLNYYPAQVQFNKEDFKMAFPEPKSSYEQRCQSSYAAVLMGEKNLIAEPELKSLREILSGYTVLVKEMSTYALDGGTNISKINSYSPQLKKLRTDAREEVIRLKRKYGVPVE